MFNFMVTNEGGLTFPRTYMKITTNAAQNRLRFLISAVWKNRQKSEKKAAARRPPQHVEKFFSPR